MNQWNLPGKKSTADNADNTDEKECFSSVLSVLSAVKWFRWVWQDKVSLVIAALRQRQVELGVPEKDEAETSPRQVVRATLT
jgi:hypothetical protein